MNHTRRKEPMSSVIREHRMLTAHMADVASGRMAPHDEEDNDMPEHFECRGCGDEMSPNDFLAFDELCRGCERERDAENAADARRDDYE